MWRLLCVERPLKEIERAEGGEGAEVEEERVKKERGRREKRRLWPIYVFFRIPFFHSMLKIEHGILRKKKKSLPTPNV
jgi:hypothetical protein